MIYLDNGATSFNKPAAVFRAMERAMHTCANPGRGGYPEAINAAKTVFSCRMTASRLFRCQPEQVVFTSNCTHGLNVAINALVKDGAKVVVTGFEHNAVVRPLCAKGVRIQIAGRKLFDQNDTLSSFENALKTGVDAAVFTHVSNVFGYILPVSEMAELCRLYCVPFIIDAAQSAGILPVEFDALQANFIAMPGHKGLLGPQGTGILLCAENDVKPLLYGGTGNASVSKEMPDLLPERLEAGTLNVPGIAGLESGMKFVMQNGAHLHHKKEETELRRCVSGLNALGFRVYSGKDQLSTVSFVPNCDCELLADALGKEGIAVRAGLHCAPLAHESAGTLETGTVRISFGRDACRNQTEILLKTIAKIMNRPKILL